MIKNKPVINRIPVSPSLSPAIEAESTSLRTDPDKKRILFIASLAIGIASIISLVAKFLIYLIDLFTNIAFYGKVSFHYLSPANNTLGLWVIGIPVIGGLIVGFMALYGSKAIRGHGIPEAMEQILINQSKIHPSITYLKPLSSAISIGTGGPFGAEGPIIATGGALGSTIGQLVKITDNERKILLAAGATAGMSAIFGSPIAAIFLAVELLLFEFSPRSIIPVALACITGAAGHHLLFESGPVFEIKNTIQTPSNEALLAYSIIGVSIGILSVLVTKIVYVIEDAFEKLPVHWMWGPAIGGLAIGIIGYFFPRTLGVGYENITDILAGTMPLRIIFSLCFFKFISWAIALGSGTSGGTLAPLLTIGGTTGALLGGIIIHFFPSAGVSLSLAALVGMSAMFAGASRALLTSIIFALETTSQANALLPLLATCSASYFVSYFMMKNTIMTEKIARRGVKTPDCYEPDILEKTSVRQVVTGNGIVVSEENSIAEVREWLDKEKMHISNYYIISSNKGEFAGIFSFSDLFHEHNNIENSIKTIAKYEDTYVSVKDSLRTAVELMARKNLDMLPVLSFENNKSIIGILSHQDIINVYRIDEHERKNPNISIKRQGMKIFLRTRKTFISGRT